MVNSDFWLDDRGAPRSVVDLRDARCRRCPAPIREVPVDKTWLLHYPDKTGFVRCFVCPHCRKEARGSVTPDEALRLFAAGVRVVRHRRAGAQEPLTEDHLIDFARMLRQRDDLAPLAFEG